MLCGDGLDILDSRYQYMFCQIGTNKYRSTQFGLQFQYIVQQYSNSIVILLYNIEEGLQFFCTQENLFRLLLKKQQELDSIYHFPIDFQPNRIPLGFKSVGKWYMHSDFGLNKQNSEQICICLQVTTKLSKVQVPVHLRYGYLVKNDYFLGTNIASHVPQIQVPLLKYRYRSIVYSSNYHSNIQGTSTSTTTQVQVPENSTKTI